MPNPQYVEARSPRIVSSFVLQGAAIATLLGLAACSQGDVVDLGENIVAPAGSVGARCQESDIIDGPIVVASQEQLNEIEGCKVIRGDLMVYAFPDADLRPLHALTTVEGALTLRSSVDPVAKEPDHFSLQGLERLERVASLQLAGLGTDSLAPLRGLRLVEDVLDLQWLPQLTDLSGLENVVSLRSLQVRSCGKLRDISALQLPPQLEVLNLLDTPLERLDASRLQQVDSLMLLGTALTDLNAFVALSTAEWLSLGNNAALEDVSALDGLSAVSHFFLQGNPRLQRLTLENLTTFRSLSIENNDALVTLPGFAHIFTDIYTEGIIPLRLAVWDAQQYSGNLYISGNSTLQRIALPPYPRAAQVEITGNTQLQEIVFSSLQLADYLSIEDNPALVDVDLGSLSVAAYLTVKNNPLLSPGSFDSVLSIERTMTGNAP